MHPHGTPTPTPRVPLGDHGPQVEDHSTYFRQQEVEAACGVLQQVEDHSTYFLQQVVEAECGVLQQVVRLVMLLPLYNWSNFN